MREETHKEINVQSKNKFRTICNLKKQLNEKLLFHFQWQETLWCFKRRGAGFQSRTILLNDNSAVCIN